MNITYQLWFISLTLIVACGLLTALQWFHPALVSREIISATLGVAIGSALLSLILTKK
ncbi:MAG: hypothetical protein WEA04_00280 [Candidatus Andersenbacteria bacterium]